MRPYEELGKVLSQHRQNLKTLHPDLRLFLQAEGQQQWLKRSTIGWTREELVALSSYLFHHRQRPPQILTALNTTVLWRMETGIPTSRRAITTYCYLLGLEWGFALQPLSVHQQTLSLC